MTARRYARYLTLLAAALLLMRQVRPASAHRNPLPLAFWGGFTPHQAYCQRIIGRAGAACANRAWAARSACVYAQVTGGNCDLQAADAAETQAHADALDAVDRECTPDDFQPLSFFLGVEADTDIDSACTTVETAFVSAVYGPALRVGSIPSGDTRSRNCIDATARAATRTLRLVARIRRQALDYIATGNLLSHEKLALMERVTVRIARVQLVLQQQIAARCDAADFMTIFYGESIAEFLSAVTAHVDCLGGAAYVQDAVVCPKPVCGNGIQETGEQCDDGNTVSGDGCSGSCMSETTSPAN